MSEIVPSGSQPQPQQATFHQIKGSNFRVVHADGTWFSMSPHSHIHLLFFNERRPLPTKTVYNLDMPDGMMKEDLSKREIRDGFIREFEVDVVLSIEQARNLHISLEEFLKINAPDA